MQLSAVERTFPRANKHLLFHFLSLFSTISHPPLFVYPKMSARKRKADVDDAVSPTDLSSSPAARKSSKTSWSAESSSLTPKKPRAGGRMSNQATISPNGLIEYGLSTPSKNRRRSAVGTSMTPTKDPQKDFEDRLSRARTER